jgi:phosphoribosylanthranilate isomerase
VDIVDSLPALVHVVGVFVDPNEKEIDTVLSKVRLTLLQFHGSEAAEFCNGFGMPYIKALRMSDDADPEIYARSYPQACALLLDTYESERYGGTGSVFSWERAKRCQSSPVIIAGGIEASNVSAALVKSGAYAVDVSSGVETSPGQKDTEKIQSFICAVRDHDQMQRHKGGAD